MLRWKFNKWKNTCVSEHAVQVYFMKTYIGNDMKEAGSDIYFAQDNQSMFTKGAAWPALLEAYDTVIDMAVNFRSNSETYGKWYGAC